MTTRIVKVVMRGEIGDLVAKAAAGGRAVASTANQMTAVTKEAEKSRRAMTTLGDSAGKMGLVAAGGLALVTKAAMDWESAWAGVTKTVDGTTAELDKVEGGLRDLAKTLPATHAEIAGVAEAAGQLGVATGDIVSFTRTMVDLGETTNLTAEEAATSIAQMANVMGTSGADVDNLGSALVALGNDGASTEKQIVEMAQGISGAAAIVGASEADVLAIANAVASMGIEVEAGGTAVSRVLTDMAKATSQGGAKLEIFAETAGMSANEFVAAFKERPAQALATFTAGLDRIRASGGDVFTTLDDLGLSEVRVSKALLGMAASGDLLTDSLDLGSKAWAENTALAEEAAKRYDTAASKGQVALNNIRDASIEFGNEALPVLAEVAEKFASIADVAGDLPQPVKAAGTQLLAITAIAGGGFWLSAKAVSSAANTRKALADLGETSPKTVGALKTLGTVTAGITVLYALAEAADAASRSFDRSLPGVNELTKALLDLDTAKGVKSIIEDIGDLDSALKRIDDPGFFNAVDEFYGKIPVLGKIGQEGIGALIDSVSGGASDRAQRDLRESTAAIQALDEAMANIATSGSPEQAKAVLDQLAVTYGLTGEQQKDLLELMPLYGEALDGAAVSAELAAGATGDLAGKQAAGGEAALLFAADQEAAAKALEESREAARDTAKDFAGLGDSLDDAEVSLGGWLKSLEDQAAALRDFTANARKAAKNDLREGLIAELEAAGPAGALRMKQLANATEDEIRRANKAWKSQQDAIRAYVNQVGGVPPTVATRLDLTGDKDALAAIRRVKSEMAGIKDKTVRLTYYVAQLNATNKPKVAPADGGTIPHAADGWTVPGHRSPYGDKVYAYLAPGEEVITNRHGEADQFRADRDAGRIPAYSDGVSFMTGRSTSFMAGGQLGSTLTSPAPATAAAGNQLLGYRETRSAQLDALRTALRELPIARFPSDPSMLFGAA